MTIGPDPGVRFRGEWAGGDVGPEKVAVKSVLLAPMSDSPNVGKSWVHASCREVFHPKAEECGPHFSNIFRSVFWQSVKLYTPFFLVVNLLNGRNPMSVESVKRLLKSVLRGSLFLSTLF